MNTVNIILPKGALGSSSGDDGIDTLMRAIANACPHEKGEWVDKYGADFENDVFMMKRYCWCESEDCPWCGGCNCPDEAFHHFVDGNSVSIKEYQDFFINETYVKIGIKESHSIYDLSKSKIEKWFSLAEKANKRREIKKDDVCDYCLGKNVFSLHGSLPHTGAPNFWHKKSGFRVWWYKYIGRDMNVLGEVDYKTILNNCLGSLK